MTTRRSTATHYETFAHSGNTGMAWALPIAGLASAGVAAFVCGWIAASSPCLGHDVRLFVLWLLTRVLLALGLAIGTVVPMQYVGILLRIRSAATMRVYGATTAVAAIYMAWVCFAWTVYVQQDPGTAPTLWSWLGHPEELWTFATSLAPSHWYNLDGLTIGAIPVWAGWIAEAAFVFATAVRQAPRSVVARGFCEPCGRWMRDEGTLHVSVDEGASSIDVRRQGLAVLQRAAPPARSAIRWLRIRRQRCPRCGTSAVYRVDQVLRSLSTGIVSMFRHDLVLHAMLGPLTDSFESRSTEVIVPLSWQREPERAELQRIAAALAAHPLTRRARR